MKNPAQYIKEITTWAKSQNTIRAIALIGSHATGKARVDSDIDFIILCEDKTAFLNNCLWLNQFGIVENASQEEWGIVTSIRVFYQDGQEIEFGLSGLNWAAFPIDPGTCRIIADGIKILKDPDKLLERLTKSKIKRQV